MEAERGRERVDAASERKGHKTCLRKLWRKRKDEDGAVGQRLEGSKGKRWMERVRTSSE